MPTWVTVPRPPVAASASTRTIIKVQVPSANKTVTPQIIEGSPVSAPRIPNAGTTTMDLPSGLTPLRGVEIAKSPKANLPQVQQPAPLPYLGYNLQSFGPFGLKWMKESQPQDAVFRDHQTSHDAELVLGQSLQRLDHTFDHHFPSNVERFGLVRLPNSQRPRSESKPRALLGTCEHNVRIGDCSSCRLRTPTFVYTHPSLKCENHETGPTLLTRFRNHSNNEIKILRCRACESQDKGGCSFNRGVLRLRLGTNGSVKIVYQPTGKRPGAVRDISETNIGIKNLSPGNTSAASRGMMSEAGMAERSGIGSADNAGRQRAISIISSDESLTELEEDAVDGGGHATASGGHHKGRRTARSEDQPNPKVASNSEDAGFTAGRKRKRSVKLPSVRGDKPNGRKSQRLEHRVTAAGRSQPLRHPPLPTPSPTSGSTASGFFVLSGQGSTSNGEAGISAINKTTGAPDHSVKGTDAGQIAKAAKQASRGLPTDIAMKLQQMRETNAALKEMKQLKEENEGLQLEMM